MDSGIKKSNIIDSNKVLPASFGKVFGAKIVDCFILILFSFAIFLGICFPILQNSSYVQLIDNKDKASKQMLSELNDSKLAVYNEKTGVLSTDESMYKVFVLQQIKYCYETYPDVYKTDLEDDGYLNYTEKLSDVFIDSYNINCLAYFYTNYIVDKLDHNGNRIVDFGSKSSKEFFIFDVIDCEGNGKEFFTYNNKEDLPHFTKDICRYMFEYHIKNVSYSTLRSVDDSLFDFFIEKYKAAGDLLLKYKNYSEPFNEYNTCYNQINYINLLCVILCYFSSYLIFIVSIPLLNKKHQTIGFMIFKIVRLDKNRTINIKSTIIDSVFDFFTYFFVTFFVSLVFVGYTVFNFTFLTFGVLTLKLIHLCGISLILDIISIFIRILSSQKRGLGSRVSGTNIFEYFIS